jgi:hypothetical protein
VARLRPSDVAIAVGTLLVEPKRVDSVGVITATWRAPVRWALPLSVPFVMPSRHVPSALGIGRTARLRTWPDTDHQICASEVAPVAAAIAKREVVKPGPGVGSSTERR